MKSLAFSLLVAAALTSSCSKSADAPNVQTLNQDFISAWNSRDSGKINGMLADDVAFVQGNAHWKGKDEVSQKWVSATLPTISNLKTSVSSSNTDAASAYEAGTFSVDVPAAGPGQPAGFGEGNYIFLWKKAADNTWKLSYAQLEDLPVQRRN
ncbi:MAG: nuclear transport factor 2 family protein [Bacteroidota bacterium]|nr:nuclear transport factor 2 family protein [Bacteroidota bacterium]